MLDVRDQFPTVETRRRHRRSSAGRDGIVAYDDLLAAADPLPNCPAPNEDESPAAGTPAAPTGRPKGAMLTHRSLIRRCETRSSPTTLQCEDRSLMCFPMCHVSGYLITQHHMVGARGADARLRARCLVSTSSTSSKITASGLAPTMMTVLLQHPGLHTHDLSTLAASVAQPRSRWKCSRRRSTASDPWCGRLRDDELGGNVLMHPVSAHVRAVNGEEHLLASWGSRMPLAAARSSTRT